jgi:hypothetical protein
LKLFLWEHLQASAPTGGGRQPLEAATRGIKATSRGCQQESEGNLWRLPESGMKGTPRNCQQEYRKLLGAASSTLDEIFHYCQQDVGGNVSRPSPMLSSVKYVIILVFL